MLDASRMSNPLIRLIDEVMRLHGRLAEGLRELRGEIGAYLRAKQA
jgi:hypothetical protein